MAPTTFRCARLACDQNTRDLHGKRWQKRPENDPDAKEETKETTHICKDCYNKLLELRHAAEEHPNKRLRSSDSVLSLPPVRPRTESLPEVNQLAAVLGAAGAQGPRRRMCESPESYVAIQDDGCKPMECDVDGPLDLKAEAQAMTSSCEENEETDANIREMIRRFQEQNGFLKANNQQAAAFLRLNPDAGPKALQAVPEVLRDFIVLQRETKAFRQARAILKESNLPPLLDLLADAVISKEIHPDHALWDELKDTFKNM
jgi:hypothetical protein